MPAQRDLDLVQPGRPRVYDASFRLYTHFKSTPAKDVLKCLPEGLVEAAALWLGCADGSCLLASLAARHPGLQNLTAILNDYHPLMLARAALLLLLAAELDPDSRKDMQVLWDVWYNIVWGPSTMSRVKPFIERLRQDSVPWLKPLRPEDKDVLQGVFSWWLTSGKPTASKWLRMREEYLATMPPDMLERTRNHIFGSAKHTFVKMDGLEAVEEALQHVTAPPGEDHLDHILQQDLEPWFQTGCMTPNYTGEVVGDAPRAANVTLIPQERLPWKGRLFTTPASCWGPFSAAEVLAAMASGSIVGLTARACIARITQLVRDFQAHTQLGPPAPAAAGDAQQQSSGRVHVQVQLVCGDALQLCLGSTLTPAAVADAQQPHSNKSKKGKKGGKRSESAATSLPTQPPQLFDVIDTSTLADDNGLLHLLVAAGARLKPVSHARLFTNLAVWNCEPVDDTIERYLQRAVPVHLTLMPTILGMRLLTDLSPDRPETSEAQECTYRVNQFRELVWAPISADLQASPLPQLSAQVLGGQPDSVEEALQAVATQLCCVNMFKERHHYNRGIDNATPHLLAWFLGSLTQRVDMTALLGTQGSKSADSRFKCSREGSNSMTHKGVTGQAGSSRCMVGEPAVRACHTTTQRLLWALRSTVPERLPAHFRFSFMAALDMLQLSLQQNVPADWQPDDVPRCPGIWQYSTVWRSSEGERHDGSIKRPVLLEAPQAGRALTSKALASKADVDGWALKGSTVPAGTHITDFWAYHPPHAGAAPSISIFLPAHGCTAAHKMQTFIAGCQTWPLLPTGPPRLVQASPILAQVLLPAACLATALQQPIHPVPEPNTQPWALQVASLTETAYSYCAVLQLVAAQAGATAGPKPSLKAQNLHVEACTKPHAHAPGQNPHSSMDAQQLCSTKHKVVISMPESVGQVQPVELLLRWPVGVTIGEAELAPGYSSGSSIVSLQGPGDDQVTVQMLKAEAWEAWPNDVAWGIAPARLDLCQLAPYSTHAEVLLYRCWHSQYLYSECVDGVPNASPSNFTRHLLRFMLQSVDTNYPTLPNTTAAKYFTISSTRQSRYGQLDETKLYLKLHKPLLVSTAGRPVAAATVVDVRMCEDAISKGLMKQDVLDQLLQQLEIGSEPDPHIVSTTDGCAEWRRMLLRKALACHPTAAQEAVLPGGSHPPYYYSTYVSFMQHMSSGYTSCSLPESERQPKGLQSSYLCNRVNELVQDYFLHQSSKEKGAEVCRELQQLLAQDTNKTIPTSLRDKAQSLLNWIPYLQPDSSTAEQATAPPPSRGMDSILAQLLESQVLEATEETHLVKHSMGPPPQRQGQQLMDLLSQSRATAQASEEQSHAQASSSVQALLDLMQKLHTEAAGHNSSDSSSDSDSDTEYIGGRASSSAAMQGSSQQVRVSSEQVKQGMSQQAGGSSGVSAGGCAGCGKQGGELLRCGGCKKVQYCSRECQAAHWKQHKGVCKKA